jgi:AbrB family looped-hinge helix DNA binding protein
MAIAARETAKVAPAAASVTSNGQVTVSKQVRDELGLRAGDKVDWVRNRSGAYELRKRAEPARFDRWRGRLDSVTRRHVDEMVDEMRGR